MHYSTSAGERNPTFVTPLIALYECRMTAKMNDVMKFDVYKKHVAIIVLYEYSMMAKTISPSVETTICKPKIRFRNTSTLLRNR